MTEVLEAERLGRQVQTTQPVAKVPEPLPIVGIELGARFENTALAVTERSYRPTGERFTSVATDYSGSYPTSPHFRQRLETREKVRLEYHVRHLERRRPPVRYKGIAERVAELVRTVGKTHNEAVVVMDITRVGTPVHSQILGAVGEVQEEIGMTISQCPVTITGLAGGVSQSSDAGWLVPRRDLVSSALLLFEEGALRIAEELELAATLSKEFPEFRQKDNPKQDIDGWREGKNDDLVLAVAISTWACERFLKTQTDVPVVWPFE